MTSSSTKTSRPGGAREEATVNAMFQATARRLPNAPALVHKVDGRFEAVTYAELARDVRTLASGLHRLGVRAGDRVAILAENGVAWARADLAVLALGAATTPIYPTFPAGQAAYILRDAGAGFAFAGDPAQEAKVASVRAELPELRQVISFQQPVAGAMSLADVMERGRAEPLPPEEYQSLWTSVLPETMATLIYTSGTTGDPKGVELTHGNFMSVVEGARSIIPWGERDTFLSFLPLCHIYERALGYYVPLAHGARIVYVEGATSVERIARLPGNFLEAQPSLFLGMPRLYEKMKEKIEDAAAKSGAKRKRIFDWSIGVGVAAARAEMRGRRPGPVTALKRIVADRLVFRKVRSRVGGRIRFLVSAGAALPAETMEFFTACGLPILEGYGLTETASLVTANRPGAMRPGTVGTPAPNAEIRIADDGEILCRGAGLMRGYWNKPAATAEAIDADGWFHTGDLGEWTPDHFLRITGRKKDLIVLSNGKKVAPQDIEEMLKSSPYITDLALMGDGSQSVVALIVPNFDRLLKETGAPDRAALAASPEAHAVIKKELQRLSTALADFEKVRKFALLDHEFTIENDELTPTLKVKRHVLAQRYADTLKALTR
jgi:long-chain acyl-CoA synthetase